MGHWGSRPTHVAVLLAERTAAPRGLRQPRPYPSLKSTVFKASVMLTRTRLGWALVQLGRAGKGVALDSGPAHPGLCRRIESRTTGIPAPGAGRVLWVPVSLRPYRSTRRGAPGDLHSVALEDLL